MLAAAAPSPPAGPAWAAELKWDGMRAIVDVTTSGLRVRSRNGNDFTECYPELGALLRLPLPSCSLDGEIVCLAPDGRPDFDRLRTRWHRPAARQAAALARSTPATFVAFDLLELSGVPRVAHAYLERRAQLLELVRGNPCTSWFAPDHQVGRGGELFEASKRAGIEGIVAKRIDSRYFPGQRSTAWLKVKNYRVETFCVGGWLPPSPRASLQLLLGRHDSRGDLVFAGSVDVTGSPRWSQLIAALEQLSSPTSPFRGLPRMNCARFTAPRLSATVQSIGESVGLLREPTLKGISLVR